MFEGVQRKKRPRNSLLLRHRFRGVNLDGRSARTRWHHGRSRQQHRIVWHATGITRLTVRAGRHRLGIANRCRACWHSATVPARRATRCRCPTAVAHRPHRFVATTRTAVAHRGQANWGRLHRRWACSWRRSRWNCPRGNRAADVLSFCLGPTFWELAAPATCEYRLAV